MQVYQDLSILTARPSAEEMQNVPHHHYGVMGPYEICDAGMWLGWLHETLPQIWERGNIPVVVGGTGLYLRTLSQGLAPVPEIPSSVRTEVTSWYVHRGPDQFSADLAINDPIAAAAIPATNRQRMIRAMEVFQHTGKPISWWQKQPHHGALPKPPITIVLEPERQWLYERCDRRFLQMLDRGAWNEVSEAIEKGILPDAPVCRGLGARYMMMTLFGDINKDEAIERAQRETRNYAKRQLTWFRNQVEADYRLHPPADELDDQSALDNLVNELGGKLRK